MVIPIGGRFFSLAAEGAIQEETELLILAGDLGFEFNEELNDGEGALIATCTVPKPIRQSVYLPVSRTGRQPT